MVQVEVPTRWDDHTAALWTLLDEPGTVAAALPGTAELADDRVHLDLPSAPDVDLVWTHRGDETSSVHEIAPEVLSEVLSAPIRLRLDGRGTLRPDLSVDLSALDAATGRQRRAWQSQVARQLAHVLLEVDLPQERGASDIATEAQTEAQTEGPPLPRADVAGPILPRLPTVIAAAGLVAVVAAVATRWWPHRARPGG